MAALPLDGFSTPEKNYNQLYQLGEANERRNYRESQLAEQRRAKRAANASMLNNLLDPKAHLSGSLYDPEITKSLQDMLVEGAELADKGADGNMILMALGPKVAQVSEYAQKAKLLKKQKDEFIAMAKPIKGIDQQKAAQAFDEMAFFQIDPETGQKKLKDIKDIDPQANYGDQVLRDGDVFTNEGLSNFVKTAGKETRNQDYRYYNKMGSLNRTKGAYTAPAFMMPEEDSRGAFKEFVPQYDIVTEDGIPKELEFHTKDGKVTAPVRMVTDAVFNSLPPEAKGYIRQEARKYAKEHGVELSSPQAYNFAKAIAYDELKESGKLSSSVSELVDNKPSTFEIKANLGIPYYKPSASGSGGGDGGSSTRGNEFDRIDLSKYGSPQNGRIDGLPAADLPYQVQAILKSAGIDVSDATNFKLELVDGQVQSITPITRKKEGKRIDRVDMENAQKKWNAEPIKSAQPKFGERKGGEVKSTKKKISW
jgi:hypothetical protein